jgi:hypothetical protein
LTRFKPRTANPRESRIAGSPEGLCYRDLKPSRRRRNSAARRLYPELPMSEESPQPISEPEAGDDGYPGPKERVRLLVLAVSMAAYLVWLFTVGVNV